MPTPAQMRKFLVVLIAFVAQLVQMNVLPAQYVPYAVAFISALAAVGVYAVPNDPK